MSTTVENIYASLQAKGYGTDTEPQAAQILNINAVHKRVLNSRRWRFMETTATKSITANSTSTALVARDLTQQVNGVRLLDANSNFCEVDNINPQRIQELLAEFPEAGEPEFWSITGQTLLLWPIPSRAYTATLEIQEAITKLTAKTDLVQVPDSHVEILVWGAIADQAFRERDWNARQVADDHFNTLLQEMFAQYGMTDKQSSKHVGYSGERDGFDLEWLI